MNLTWGQNQTLAAPQALRAGTNAAVLFLCITINYINAAMVHTFHKHHVFRTSPRFILFIHLVVNDMIQLSISSTLFLLSTTVRTVSVHVCCLLVVPAVATTQNTPLNLSLMATECCLAVCAPLRYAGVCSVLRTRLSIALMWSVSLLSVLPDVVLLWAAEPPDFRRSRIFCNRDTLFRRAESQSRRDVSHILLLGLVWSTLVYTYLRILLVAKAADGAAKKARSTILLHAFQMLLSMLVYVQPMVLQGAGTMAPAHLLLLHFLIFILNQMLPRFLSPFIYGFRDKTFWRYLKKNLCGAGSQQGAPPPGRQAKARK